MTYLYEIPAHFIHEVKTKGYDVIEVTVIHRKLMRLWLCENFILRVPHYWPPRLETRLIDGQQPIQPRFQSNIPLFNPVSN